MPKDYFYVNLYNYNKNGLRSKKYSDTINYYKDKLRYASSVSPKMDKDIKDSIKNNKTLQLINKEYSSKELRTKLIQNFGEKPMKYNIFMAMDLLLTNYIFSEFEDENPVCKIGLNGRNWTEDKNTVGCLIYNLPVTYNFKNKEVNMKDFYMRIKEFIEKKNELMKYPFEHNDNLTSMFAIIQTKNFYRDKFCGKKMEILYYYDNYVNMKNEYLLNPFTEELFIDDNICKFSIFFDGKYYKESSAEKYIQILKKCSDLILDNLNNEKNINLEKIFFH